MTYSNIGLRSGEKHRGQGYSMYLLIIRFKYCMLVDDRQIQELLSLTRANNEMLRQIVSYINVHGNPRDDQKDFIMNLVANLLSNKINVGNFR